VPISGGRACARSLRPPRPIGCVNHQDLEIAAAQLWPQTRSQGYFEGWRLVEREGKRVSASISWLFHTRRTEEDSGEFTRTSRRLAKEEIAQERRWESSASEGGACAGLTQRSAWPLFVDFEALAQRQDALFGGLTPLHEKTALVTFVGMGITDANRYEDAAAAFKELRRMAPAHNGALIEVFTQRHREESKGSDFLYLHFAGDRLAFGLQICALTSGGLMAGWQLS
jgi:hypothetical protein